VTTQEQVRLLAYQLWERDGKPVDKDQQEYWAEAQRQLDGESPLTQTDVPPPKEPAPLVAGHPQPAQNKA
jgi:hypothetical protein